jgi:tetratricopeptide (TPR) repeat protein
MPPSPPPRRAWPAAAVRAGLGVLALALAVVPVLRHRELRARQAEAEARLHEAGVTQEVALDREADPEQVRLRAARAVLASELRAAPEALAESAERLAGTARVAGSVLVRRPSAWDAAMIHGAATYFGWSRARDPRLFTKYRRWEAPLEAALELAPGKREPVRFLATAYLEVWPALSPRKKEIARGLLAEVFRDPEDLRRLLGAWLDVAASRGEAFSVLPDEPEVWERVQAALAERGDWQGFRAARARRDEALLADLRRDLAEADRLRRGGDLRDARALYLSVAARARPDVRGLPVLESALARCPPGPVDRQTGERLAPHLAWALDRCLRERCPLEPPALKRLARFVREPRPQEEALAYLFAGDLPRAASLERRADSQWTESWAPYLLAKARILAEKGRMDEAEAALAEVHRDWEDHPLTWQARIEVARAAGDAAALDRAEAGLAALGRASWPATAWTWRGGLARLEMVPASAARGFSLALDEVPAGGAVVELRLDGALLGAFPLRPGPAGGTALAVTAPLGPRLHLLEMETTVGERVLPGEVLLR